MRKHTNGSLDKRVFKNTAKSIKAVNIYRNVQRGGIRF